MSSSPVDQLTVGENERLKIMKKTAVELQQCSEEIIDQILSAQSVSVLRNLNAESFQVLIENYEDKGLLNSNGTDDEAALVANPIVGVKDVLISALKNHRKADEIQSSTSVSYDEKTFVLSPALQAINMNNNSDLQDSEMSAPVESFSPDAIQLASILSISPAVATELLDRHRGSVSEAANAFYSQDAVEGITQQVTISTHDQYIPSLSSLDSTYEENLLVYQAIHPFLLNTDKRRMLWMLVHHAGFEMHAVVETMATTACGNIGAFLRLHRSVFPNEQELHRQFNHLDVYASLPEDDVQIIALMRMLLDQGYVRDEVADAIWIDRCRTLADALDVLTDDMKIPLQNSATGASSRVVEKALSQQLPISVKRVSRRSDGWGIFTSSKSIPDPLEADKLGRRAILYCLELEKVKVDSRRNLSTRELRVLLLQTLCRDYDISKRDVDLVTERYQLNSDENRAINGMNPLSGTVESNVASATQTRASAPLDEFVSPAVNSDPQHEAKKAQLVRYQNEFPFLLCKHKQNVMWILVQHARFDMSFVVEVMERTGCGNVFAFIRTVRAEINGIDADLSDVEITQTDKQNDVILAQLVKLLLEVGCRDNVLDAIAIDRCVTEDDGMDSLNLLDDWSTSSHNQFSAVFVMSTSPCGQFVQAPRRNDWRDGWRSSRTLYNVPDPTHLGRQAIISTLVSEGVVMTEELHRKSTRELRLMLFQTLRKVYVIAEAKLK